MDKQSRDGINRQINQTIFANLRHNYHMENEQLIISRAKNGNIQYFQKLVELYSHRLYAAAYRILGDKEHAEDCIQEVFIKVHKKIGTFNEQSKFSTWLYSVTVNTAIDIQRKHAKHSKNDSESFDTFVCESSNNPEKYLDRDDISATTQRAIMQLSEDTRLAFILRHHEERSVAEISEILGINPNTVKNRIFRAVSRLRELLQPLASDFD